MTFVKWQILASARFSGGRLAFVARQTTGSTRLVSPCITWEHEMNTDFPVVVFTGEWKLVKVLFRDMANFVYWVNETQWSSEQWQTLRSEGLDAVMNYIDRQPTSAGQQYDPEKLRTLITTVRQNGGGK